MKGGTGYDTFYVDNTGDRIFDVGSETDKVWSSINVTGWLPGNIERIYLLGGGSASSAYGNAGNNVIQAWNNIGNFLYGMDGKDEISGYYGSDKLYGGRGDDTLYGHTYYLQSGDMSRDYLYGNEDNDTLWGDNGSDILDGGPGNDIIRGGKQADELRGGPGADRFQFYGDDTRNEDTDEIFDFNRSEGDKIDFWARENMSFVGRLENGATPNRGECGFYRDRDDPNNMWVVYDDDGEDHYILLSDVRLDKMLASDFIL